jgi:hypothetical protein
MFLGALSISIIKEKNKYNYFFQTRHHHQQPTTEEKKYTISSIVLKEL